MNVEQSAIFNLLHSEGRLLYGVFMAQVKKMQLSIEFLSITDVIQGTLRFYFQKSTEYVKIAGVDCNPVTWQGICR